MKTALGKGLDALIPGKGEEVVEVEVGRIARGAAQPRTVFRDESLKELAASIKEKGVLQPVLLTRGPDGSLTLIAGERRFRAAQLAGLKKLPAIVKQVSSEDALEIALIENIQREDLSPLETARAFQRLGKQFGLTQEQVAGKVGKERATVANYLRLLGLPDEVKDLVDAGTLSMGHARALLSLSSKQEMLAAARKVVARGLSVRETEALAARKDKKPQKAPRPRDPDLAALEEKLVRSLATKVRVKHRGKKGSIEIDYYSLEELDRLLDILLQG
ncbi:MAG: ParB/RepB/Spo0J family partition protein [Nitrospirota bacterium]|jgi:ParB family chromosome partitioning protein